MVDSYSVSRHISHDGQYAKLKVGIGEFGMIRSDTKNHARHFDIKTTFTAF